MLARLAAGYWQVSQIVRRAQHQRRECGRSGDPSLPHCSSSDGSRSPAERASNSPAVQRPTIGRKRYAGLQSNSRHTHIRRRDHWVNLLADLVCALYWFHPLAWMLRRRLLDEQESACDDATIESGFTPAAYGEALLAVAQQLPSRLPLSPLVATRSYDQSNDAPHANLSPRCLAAGAPPFSFIPKAYRVFRNCNACDACGARSGGCSAKKFTNSETGSALPRVIQRIEPEYTTAAHDAKITGMVRLSLVVGVDGRATDVEGCQKVSTAPVSTATPQPQSGNGNSRRES